MFQPSSQPVSYRQQIITLSHSYPCPRCSGGVLESGDLTETLHCNHCIRSFVPLRAGRFLYPSNSLGWKIAPIFWWDGFRWHWGGTTATTKQLCAIIMLSLVPVFALLGYASVYKMPHYLEPTLLSPIVGLVTMQLMYLLCWDFDFFCRRPRVRPHDESVKDVR